MFTPPERKRIKGISHCVGMVSTGGDPAAPVSESVNRKSMVVSVRLEFQSRSSTQNQCLRYSIATKASSGFFELQWTTSSGWVASGGGMGTVRF